MQRKYKILRARYVRFRKVRLPRKIRRLRILSRHPHAVPLFTFSFLIILTAAGLLAFRNFHQTKVTLDTRIVIISHDHQQQVVPSREATVGGLLKKAKVRLNQGDVVEPAMSTRIDQDQFRINIYRAVPVEVVDGTTRTFTFSAAKTPRSVASQAGVQVYSEDNISTKPAEDFIKTASVGEQVVIDRAVPVNLNLYGTPVATRTHADTVGELIKQKNIHIAKDDQLMPAADTPLTPNTQVFVVRNGIKIESETQTIAMPIQTISDPTLAYGTSAVRQAGSPGKQIVTYQSLQKNSVTVSRTVLQTVVTQAPVTQVVVMGTSLSGIKGDMALAGIAPSDYNYADYIISHESGWRPNAGNASGAYGLCQALPGSKMASAGADWATNPITQLRWCSGYAASRYGGWAGAYNHWLSSHNW